ncbi:glycoside hydrolase family 3 protein [Streptomyces sp. NBC_01341]|uniref:glycoside hydrolase family 3 N-terminal domain-containing protein n=1 Tax=Streptomyces sp. NBC_01341 TaxID=2903831 RepID=UPI002E0E4527|nr:glycoside hydrolase family 3 protein [Streptomyces sp. NBC_01341]
MTLRPALSRGSRVRRAVWPVPLLTFSLVAAGLGVAHTSQAMPTDAASARRAPQAATCVDTVFAAMSGPQRVGQLFMGGVNASKPDQKRIAVLRKYHVGAVFLAGRSKSGTKATKSLADSLQAKADTAGGHRVGLLVSTDQEGGQVQVLSGPGFSTIPSGLTQGTWSTSKLRGSAATWAKQLKAAGVNLNLAPVADVVPSSLGKNNAPIGRYDREYGHSAATVAPHSTAFAEGFAQADVLATLKHFPGLGYVRGNTDTTAKVVDSVTTRNSASIAPFRSGIKAHAPFVMISLATYSKIDPKHRAVFSPTVIQEMLRKSLGFTGVVISDDLGNAVAVKSVPPADRAVKFLSAGGDQVLTVEPNLVPAMAKAVQTRMAADAAFRAKVDKSVHRILAAKQKAGVLRCS